MIYDKFSRHAIVFQIEQGLHLKKTGIEVALVFRKLFLANTASSYLWRDNGTEFYNQQLKAVLAAKNVTLYSTEKSSIVERLNRTEVL